MLIDHQSIHIFPPFSSRRLAAKTMTMMTPDRIPLAVSCAHCFLSDGFGTLENRSQVLGSYRIGTVMLLRWRKARTKWPSAEEAPPATTGVSLGGLPGRIAAVRKKNTVVAAIVMEQLWQSIFPAKWKGDRCAVDIELDCRQTGSPNHRAQKARLPVKLPFKPCARFWGLNSAAG